MTSDRFKGYLTAEPRDRVYRALLQNLARYAASASLVVRQEFGLSQRGDGIVRELARWRRTVEIVSEWPGTELLEGGTAELQTFAITEESLSVLQHAVSGMFEWKEGYPEDLALYRPDGRVIFWSVAHESEGELEVDSGEREWILQPAGIEACIVWQRLQSRTK